MSKHASGPWQVVPELDDDGNMTFCLILNNNRKEIANTANGNFGDEEEYANAHLIAAAPEMLEALETGIKNLKYYPSENYFAIKLFEEVIKKAKGELE